MTSRPGWIRALGLLVALAAGVFALVTLVHGLVLVAFPEQFEYGEGAVLELATLAARGEPLYRDPAALPWVFCPYPPLYFALAALLGGGAPAFWPGRLASLAATLALALLLGRHLGRRGAAAGLALLLADAVVLGWSALYRVDMVALAFTMAGLAAASRLLEARPENPVPWRAHLGVAGLFLLAFLTKHSFLAAPAAVTLAWAGHRRSEGLRFGSLFGLLVAGAVGVLAVGTDGWFWAMVTRYTAMPWVPAQLLDYLGSWSLAHLPGLALGAFGVLGAWRRGPAGRLWVLYLVLALALVVGTGRYGAFLNYYLEPHLALAVLGAAAWARVTGPAPVPTRGGAAVGALLALQVLVTGPNAGYYYLFSPYDYLRYETLPAFQGRRPPYFEDGVRDGQARREALAARPGPVLAENLGHLVVLDRLPWLCDPSSYFGLAGRGLWSEDALLEALHRRVFAAVLLQKLEGNIRFSPRVLEAVQRDYRLQARVGPELLFVPAGQEGPGALGPEQPGRP